MVRVDHDPPPSGGLHRQEEGRYCAHCQRPIQRLAPKQTADRNVKTIAECLADELINADQGSPNWSTADSSSEAASSKQKLIREKNKFHSKINVTYSKINSKIPNRRLKYPGVRPERVLNITKSLGIPRQIKVKHNVFSITRREKDWPDRRSYRGQCCRQCEWLLRGRCP